MIIFKAVGVGLDKKQYDCSFQISWPATEKPTQVQKQEVANIAVKQFQEYHPNGRIIQNMEIN